MCLYVCSNGVLTFFLTLTCVFFVSGRLVCYTCQYRTNVYGQFCNKTVTECGEDEVNCMSYHYSNKNNTGIFGKSCAKDKECKNTTKTCEDRVKRQHFLSCSISCCRTHQCNRGSTRRHISISVVLFTLQLSVMFR